MRAAEVLVQSMAEAARCLETLALDRKLRWVNERDHLAKCFRETLVHHLPGTGYRPAAPGERRCDLPDHFPRVGDVDALLVPGKGQPVWVELKCSSDAKWALAACGWDAVKCAVGVCCGVASEAFMLAGAPTALWRLRVLGAGLFADGTWRAEDVRETFQTEFRSYEELADPRPTLVPVTFVTERVGEPAKFIVGETLWELRLARVSAAGDGWYTWPSFLTHEEQSVACDDHDHQL